MFRIAPFLLLVLLLETTNGNAQSTFNKLVWADEFNQSGLPDSSKWGYDKGMGCPDNCGWGNHEKQFYTTARKENARIEDGILIIEARKESFDQAGFTSARLVSKHKGDWLYGRIEVKAKLPAGKGIWPAIWMLPTNWEYGGWPQSGEIDIMENVGYLPDSVFGTVHTGKYNGMLGTQKGKSTFRNDLSKAFHVYAIEWNEKSIFFFVDGERYNEFVNDGTGIGAWPFNKAFHLLLNIAVGGDWGGKFGVDESIFPQRMEVDYVRVYQ
jgi:beta-glucanase (GH16 family)